VTANLGLSSPIGILSNVYFDDIVRVALSEDMMDTWTDRYCALGGTVPLCIGQSNEKGLETSPLPCVVRLGDSRSQTSCCTVGTEYRTMMEYCALRKIRTRGYALVFGVARA
jgi:hypothetical protein